jgi:Fe-S cluster assembly scaffold protein SufB
MKATCNDPSAQRWCNSSGVNVVHDAGTTIVIYVKRTWHVIIVMQKVRREGAPRTRGTQRLVACLYKRSPIVCHTDNCSNQQCKHLSLHHSFVEHLVGSGLSLLLVSINNYIDFAETFDRWINKQYILVGTRPFVYTRVNRKSCSWIDGHEL